ncbi:MAG: (2Fe-2S) ferredoxin domain-containing protein [Bacteroidetes bacterium]|nr:(2Fe-2S) ferredoxin domain-containing protein [Bacteroidota bacterium]
MDAQLEIIICLGSSCFSRGNSKNLKIIQDYLKKNHLEHKIDFRGHLCSEHCNRGPVMRINGKWYEQVDESNIMTILEETLGGIK